MIGGLPFAPKPRVCEACPKAFIPQRMGQRVCGPRCAVKLGKIQKADQVAKTRTQRESMKTMGELIAEAQAAFNEYIRARDAGLPCICCGNPMQPDKPGGSVDAGHFRSRGAAGHLRFNEDNCFAQRKNCNRPGGGTYAEFRAGVVARIGEARVLALESDNGVRKWTKDELRDIRSLYRAKLKHLKKESS